MHKLVIYKTAVLVQSRKTRTLSKIYKSKNIFEGIMPCDSRSDMYGGRKWLNKTVHDRNLSLGNSKFYG